MCDRSADFPVRILQDPCDKDAHVFVAGRRNVAWSTPVTGVTSGPAASIEVGHSADTLGHTTVYRISDNDLARRTSDCISQSRRIN